MAGRTAGKPAMAAATDKLNHVPPDPRLLRVTVSSGCCGASEIVPALIMTLTTTSDDAPGYMEIRGALEHAGWAIEENYDADGPDGTRFGMLCREALCLVNGFRRARRHGLRTGRRPVDSRGVRPASAEPSVPATRG